MNKEIQPTTAATPKAAVQPVPRGRKITLTELVLRDGHQSLLATRMRLDDMLPIAEQMDKVGYWSVESWGGATFDSCIRFLGEDPWLRIRELSRAMPNTPQQMLLRGQNILGYRHYADDVVHRFVELAHKSGVKVFRIFDALNDIRNLRTAIRAVIDCGGHAQGTLSYTVSPVHTPDGWTDLAKRLEDAGVHSLAIKDMSGLLTPYAAYRLVKKIKDKTNLRVHIHCHATTGMSTATALKSIEAGADTIDTSISSMSMTYGHSATESLVNILNDSSYDTGLDMELLQKIADHFRSVRPKYAKFEGSLKGIDARILKAQVPGGMLSNLENQLREQNAEDKMDELLEEIPEVRKDLGYIPLVTPTSQIVGTQSVLNVLGGERYKNISKETLALVKGEYGKTPSRINSELWKKVWKGEAPKDRAKYDPSARPPELSEITKQLRKEAEENKFSLSADENEDILTYALFPQVGLRFFMNRDNPAAFEPKPGAETQTQIKEEAQQPSSDAPDTKQETSKPAKPSLKDKKTDADRQDTGTYSVTVDGKEFLVRVRPSDTTPAESSVSEPSPLPADSQTKTDAAKNETAKANDAGTTDSIKLQTAPLAGNIFRILVVPDETVTEGQPLFVLEAMKMETEVCAILGGRVKEIYVRQGDKVSVGDKLLSLV